MIANKIFNSLLFYLFIYFCDQFVAP